MEALWDATVATEFQKKKLGTTSRAQNIECACGKEARPTGWLHRSLVIIRVVGPCIQKLAATRGGEGGGRPAPAPHHTSVLGARRGVVARGERVRARLTAKHGRATATYRAWHLHPRQVGGGVAGSRSVMEVQQRTQPIIITKAGTQHPPPRTQNALTQRPHTPRTQPLGPPPLGRAVWVIGRTTARAAIGAGLGPQSAPCICVGRGEGIPGSTHCRGPSADSGKAKGRGRGREGTETYCSMAKRVLLESYMASECDCQTPRSSTSDSTKHPAQA